jgi:predicted transcriptional regulator
MTDEKEKKLAQSEKFLNYAKGLAVVLPVVGALALGVINMFKGEPVAEKTWETVRDKLNEQSKVIDKLTKRVLYWQGHEAGRSAGAIYEKLQQAEKQNESLMAQIATKKVKKAKTPQEVKILIGKLVEERALRKKLEGKKAKMEKRMNAQKPLPKLAPLPKKLKDAYKK